MRRSLRIIKNFITGKPRTGNTVTPPNKKYLATRQEELLPVSICIPCYEMYGKGAMYLGRSLDMLSRQTWKNFEVVVSDHSTSDLIKDCCDQYRDRLNIVYIRNEQFRGSSCGNANVALDHASNPVIRILFQDDYLADEESLERASKYFTYTNARWMATACKHQKEGSNDFYWELFPKKFNEENLFKGLNTIGCPSVIMTRKNDIRFDLRLPALMDLDYYQHLYGQYGPPVLFHEINVIIGIHPGQVTNNGGAGDPEQVRQELAIVFEKFNKQPA